MQNRGDDDKVTVSYEIFIANKKAEKRLREYMAMRNDISMKLDKLKINPRKEAGAYPLHGRLVRKWGCWLGSNIRMVYGINDFNRLIVVEAVGTHKVY